MFIFRALCLIFVKWEDVEMHSSSLYMQIQGHSNTGMLCRHAAAITKLMYCITASSNIPFFPPFFLLFIAALSNLLIYGTS